MTIFSDVVAKYSDGDVVSARARLTEIADYYSKKAKNLGYVPLVGAATTSGLLSLLFRREMSLVRLTQKSFLKN